ncbi:MAG: zinc ABC transporter substrate-binding protein ZnuA [Pseudomonadota bacterium]
MRLVKSLLLASTLLSTSTLVANAEIKVVASIKPVHSLVSAVMEGVGTPDLIVEGAASPHTYALKPSQAVKLENADVVFWIGHEIESFLEKPLEAIATKAKAVELIDAHDLVKLEFREGGAFREHDHGHGEEHADHDDHDHEVKAEKDHDHDHDHEVKAEKDHDHDHDHEVKAEKDHDHDHDHEVKAEKDHDHSEHAGHEGHDHGEFDSHVWLDPINAKALVHEIEETLAKADPANADKYEANADAVMKRLDGLVTELSASLEPVKGKGFIVFHDAYQYFENRFGLTASGSITISPEVQPGAERISELQDKVKELKATCVFSEPQFEPKLVATVTEGTQAKTGVLDPLGTSIEDGPELYFTLLSDMADSFRTCLSEAS